MSNSRLIWQVLKCLVFLLSAIPFALLAVDTAQNNLGANPLENLHFRTGDWALRFLLITLALSPIKIIFGYTHQLRFRRMMGLFAFFYASLHLFIYVVLEQSMSWKLIVAEVPKSPYIIVGLATYLLLVPLAVTSTSGMMRRLGKHWKTLHRSIYGIGILAVIHFFWLVKADITEPLIYALVLTLLLGVRVFRKSTQEIGNKGKRWRKSGWNAKFFWAKATPDR